MKKSIFIIIIILFLIILFKIIISYTPENKTIFNENIKSSNPYIYDDFSEYNNYSEIIEAPLEDLSRWRDKGTITAWLNVKDFKKINSVNLILEDVNGKDVVLKGMKNINISRDENKIKSDDVFPDYYFNCPNQSLNKWEDFMIINGNNLIFWEWNQSLNIDMSKIISVREENGLNLIDIVIHDGLCKEENSLNGEWYTPNGLPQYGVWWIKKDKLIMKNVEIEQYPSNGDHVRILSEKTTPKNFILRTRFKVINLKPDYTELLPAYLRTLFNFESTRKNTFIRIAWDFDNIYDPGHDQTILYNSLEYNYFGLQRVYPKVRYFEQEYEPDINYKPAKMKVRLKNNQEYEINVFVKNQLAIAEIYEITFYGLKKIGSVEYKFEKERPEKSYPFSIETTGNVNVELDLMEVRKI